MRFLLAIVTLAQPETVLARDRLEDLRLKAKSQVVVQTTTECVTGRLTQTEPDALIVKVRAPRKGHRSVAVAEIVAVVHLDKPLWRDRRRWLAFAGLAGASAGLGLTGHPRLAAFTGVYSWIGPFWGADEVTRPKLVYQSPVLALPPLSLSSNACERVVGMVGRPTR